jgi:D-threo-aldose 1-dehydrogenase
MKETTHEFTTCGGRTIPFGALGFGSAPLANMHRAVSEREAEEAIDSAWSSGIRYFDTAPLYGHGLAEERLGKGLRGRTGFVISTKVGRLLEKCPPGAEDSGIYVNTPQLRARFDYSYDGIMRSFEESLRRLGLDHVDILFVHDVDARSHGGRTISEGRIRELIDGGGWRALSDLRATGAVAAIGAGVNEWEPCLRLLELADPDLFLLAGRYTLLEQEPLFSLFPHCEARGVRVIAGGPFNSGILAGKPTYDYGSVPPHISARVGELAAVCRTFGLPLGAVALKFPLAHPTVACVLAGSQTGTEVKENAAFLQLNIPAALWRALKERDLIDSRAPVPDETPTDLNSKVGPTAC